MARSGREFETSETGETIAFMVTTASSAREFFHDLLHPSVFVLNAFG